MLVLIKLIAKRVVKGEFHKFQANLSGVPEDLPGFWPNF